MLRLNLPLFCSRNFRPYQQVLRAVEQSDGGLLTALGIFRQFEQFYKERTVFPVAVKNNENSQGPVTKAIQINSKPLTEFCGNAKDVEPFTIVLLKVLCDLQKLDDMRFLFMQCVLELDGQFVSAELFNVYLLAISMTDTFNQNEVENVVELMRAKSIVPDVVTKLSLFILYLRLGIEESSVWWPMIRKEVLEILEKDEVANFPLLPLRILHCFQTLVRLHHNTALVDECFALVRKVCPTYLDRRNITPYVLLSIANTSSSPDAIVEALQSVDGPVLESSSHAGGEADDGNVSRSSLSPHAAPNGEEPVLRNEVTIFRLLGKCATLGSVSAFEYVVKYIDHHKERLVFTGDNLSTVSLLRVYAYCQSGDLSEALRGLESVDAPLAQPGSVPQIVLPKNGKVFTVLPVDVIQCCVFKLVEKGPVGIEKEIEIIKKRLENSDGTGRGDVSVAGLNIILAAYAHSGEVQLAEQLFSYFLSKPLPVNSATLSYLLQSYRHHSPEIGLKRARSLRKELNTLGVSLNSTYLNTAMELSLNAGDTHAALEWLRLYPGVNCVLPERYSSTLLKKLALGLDSKGIENALKYLRESGSHVDLDTVRRCAACFSTRNLKCKVLNEYLKQ